MLIKICSAACLTLLLLGCRSGEEPKHEFSYFPIETGMSAEYNVTRTTYSLNQPAKTQTSVIRAIISDTLENASGKMVHYQSFSTLLKNQSWRRDSSSIVWSDMNRILGIEGGQIIVKLTMPLADRNFWNGNAYNNSGERFFKVTKSGTSFDTGSELFSNTVTIVRLNDSTLIGQKKHTEVYAQGVGLIRREIAYLNFCYDATCQGKAIINSGYREISVIKNHEK